MFSITFYLGDALAPDSFEAAIMVFQLVKAVIGLAIAYIAYRGYRKNESRPMLFLCLGFVLVLGVPFVLYLGVLGFVAIVGAPAWSQAAVIAIAELSQVTGLIAILYALKL